MNRISGWSEKSRRREKGRQDERDERDVRRRTAVVPAKAQTEVPNPGFPLSRE
jgi:hypothetical protein